MPDDEVLSIASEICTITDVKYNVFDSDDNTLIRATVLAQIDDNDVMNYIIQFFKERIDLKSQVEALRKEIEDLKHQIDENKDIKSQNESLRKENDNLRRQIEELNQHLAKNQKIVQDVGSLSPGMLNVLKSMSIASGYK